MDKVRGSYKAAIWLIYLSLFVFFAGFSLVYALGSQAPFSGGSVMLLSGASLLFSVLCSLVCLVGWLSAAGSYNERRCRYKHCRVDVLFCFWLYGGGFYPRCEYQGA